MVEFFRDVLNGPLYIVVVIIALVLIMAIIGFLMEKKQKQVEKEESVVHVGTEVKQEEVDPISNPGVFTPMNQTAEEVSVGVVQNNNVEQVFTNDEIPSSQEEPNISEPIKAPVFVFEDPDEKKENV